MRFVSLVLGLGLEHSCPWPRECLSSERLSLALALASDFFCVLGLGLEPCVLDSTSAIEHVCYDCPISRLILLRLQNYIRDKICTNVILSKPLILFNVCNQPGSYKTFILKATSIFRVVVLEQKILLDISNQVLAKKNAFIHSSCERIFSELNNLIKTEFPFLPAQCSGVT